MPLETTVNSIADLNEQWPVGSSDLVSQGDDHIRILKQALKLTFAGVNKPLTGTADQSNAITDNIDATQDAIVVKKPVNFGNKRLMGVGYPTAVSDATPRSWIEQYYYRRDEIDPKFVLKTITINGKPLSADVLLRHGDVGAEATGVAQSLLTAHKAEANAHTIDHIAGLVAALAAKLGLTGGHLTGPLTSDSTISALAFNILQSLHLEGLNHAHLTESGITVGYDSTADQSLVQAVSNGEGGLHLKLTNTSGTVFGHIQIGKNGRLTLYKNGDRDLLSLMPPDNHDLLMFTSVNEGSQGKQLAFRLDDVLYYLQTYTSDASFKEAIEDVPAGAALDALDQLRPVSYHHKDAPAGVRVEYGVIAQELEKVIPSCVATLPDGKKEIQALSMLGFLLATVKDLQHEIAQLRADAGL